MKITQKKGLTLERESLYGLDDYDSYNNEIMQKLNEIAALLCQTQVY